MFLSWQILDCDGVDRQEQTNPDKKMKRLAQRYALISAAAARPALLLN